MARKGGDVPQTPRLLHASVSDNIRYLRAVSDAAVEDAARLACIHDDIVTWEGGYNAIIGPRADAISGGQQQRICIARALVARPEILVIRRADERSRSTIGAFAPGITSRTNGKTDASHYR